MSSEQATNRSISVFLSYVGDVATFVQQFSMHFIDNKGVMKKFDWLIDPVTAGAELHKELVTKINEADVFIAFVDKSYPDKIGAEELKSALDARSDGNGRPLLIPIILGVDGLNWWTKLKDRTPDPLSNIVYQKFFHPGTNSYRTLTVEDEQAIHKLRDWVIQYPWVLPAAPTGTPQTTPPQISPTLSQPIAVRPDDVAGAQGEVRRRVTVAFEALDNVEAHITTLREFFRNIGDFLGGHLEATRPAASMGRREEIQAELRREGVPSRLTREVVEIIARRDEAIKICNKDSRNTELLKLADQLNALIEREHILPASNQKGAFAFYYLSRMEEALMRTQTEKPEALSAAIRIYRELEEPYGDRPTIPYRLGWAYYREQKWDDALAQYTKARVLIKEALAPGPSKQTVQAGYELTQMRKRLPRYIGLIYWEKSEESERARKTENQLDDLLTAYNVTAEGLTISEETDNDYHNDMLYYGLQYLEIFEKNRAALPHVGKAQISEDMVLKHLEYLESRINIEFCDDLAALDTLCYAYDFFKHDEKAIRTAKRLQYLLLLAPNRPTALDSLLTTAASRVVGIIDRSKA